MYYMKDNLTKYTGNYKSPDDIQNFKISIRLKEATFDDEEDEEVKWHIKEFSWQQKVFTKMEREYYSNIKNCITEVERNFHKLLADDDDYEKSIFSTYTDQDYYNIDDLDVNMSQTNLTKLMESLNLNKQTTDRENDNEFEKSVLNAMENKVISCDVEKMFICADLGEYVEDLWIKYEVILCTIKYDKISKTLSVYPDFTTTKPYILRIQSQSLRFAHYFIENSSTSIPDDEEFKQTEILRKISEKTASIRNENIEEFFLPPKNKMFAYLFVDILSAKGFEYDDLFMQYFIDLPEHWFCENPESLSGITSTSRAKGEDGLVYYGHNFDVVLEYNIQSLQDSRTPKCPCIYFQIVSKSSWERYRTEGIAFQNLPISRPGCHLYDLSCFRFDSNDCSGRLRRYFIGDAYNYKDVRWVGLPIESFDNGIINKFGVHTIGTGQIKFRLNVLLQSQAFLKEFNEDELKGKFVYEKLNSSSLIRSVNQVLLAFKKARRKMYEIKKTL